jgi:arginyl-tRNA synthetase
VISSDLRSAVRQAVAAAGFPPGAEPGLRPTGIPGQYAASVALTLGEHPVETARGLAVALAGAPWIEKAEVTGPGYLTITVTGDALAAVADQVTQAGPGCAASDALAGLTVRPPPPGDPLAAATWEEARAALAERLTARLAAAAGATVAGIARHRSGQQGQEPGAGPRREETAATGEIAAAVAFAGRDAVTFALARATPGKPLRVDPAIIARHVAGNPAYAVRYAHARAASGARWAVASRGETFSPAALVPADGSDTMAPFAIGPGRRHTGGYGGSLPRETAALLDALSWLPERVAVAARRGRPDEFARYLEELADETVDALSAVRHPGNAAAPGSDRLALAMAARTGLAAGLGLLEVSAPERL